LYRTAAAESEENSLVSNSQKESLSR